MNEDAVGEEKAVSLHRRIAAELAQQVGAGTLKPGAKLPSERHIARQFQASRATVRTALGHLERQGIIARRERRSAVVAMRRKVAPYLRIGFSSAKLLSLFERLGRMQVGLPARCQLQLFDLDQPGTIGQMTSQPTTGSDVLICELEHIRCFGNQPQYLSALPEQLLTDANVAPTVRSICTSSRSGCFALPLAIWPVVLYYNRNILGSAAVAPIESWQQCTQLADAAGELTSQGRYGLQFRPSLGHLAAVLAGNGTQLYGSDGRVSSDESAGLASALRFIHDLVHVRRATPLLGRADALNLFADGRCAMAIDGFDAYGLYADRLGSDLGVRSAPATGPAYGCGGFALVAMAGEDNSQAIEDLSRLLLTETVQKTFMDNRAGLSIRQGLWDVQSLVESGLQQEHARVFAEELGRWQGANLPVSQEHKQAVERLLLEFWLGLDSVETICSRFAQL